jgi:MoaA/NifB/PqqE/SkfB family radical SAM enzyme
MKQNVYSDLKIFGFPEKVASFREGRVTAPIYVRIKPTNQCNHGCRFCTYSDGTKRPKDVAADHLQTGMHSDMREKDIMPTHKALELLEDLAAMGTRAVTFSGGGEPLMHPDIVAIMTKALHERLDLSIITNGQALSEKRAAILWHAKWVRVSIDYTSRMKMAESRHVPERFYDQVIHNLAAFARTKPASCDLGVNFIVTRYNCEHLTSFAAMLKELGVGNVRFSPVYVDGFAEYHAPIAERVREQLREIQTFTDETFSVNSTYVLEHPSKARERPFARCLYAQTVPVVGADLGVYACHNTAYSSHGRIGSIAERRFREMWFAPETAEWFQKFNPSCVCRHECANHSKVELFEKLAQSHPDNFV